MTELEYGDGCEQCEYSPGAYYQHADDCYDEEDGGPNLCSGTGAHFEDCRGQWIPCPECSPTTTITRSDHAPETTSMFSGEDRR